MSLKTRRTNALLAQLAPVIDGEASDGRLIGSYQAYSVEAWPHSGNPVRELAKNPTGDVPPASVDMLRVTLFGLTGVQVWHCQSAAGSLLQDFVSKFTVGSLLKRFKPGEFRFEGVDAWRDAGEQMGAKLAKRLGVPMRPNADPALQERLIAAGLFDELDALRWGGHPYLPMIAFTPGGRELTEQVYVGSPAFARTQPAIDARLRAAGLPDYRALLEAKMHETEQNNPGRLQLDVEAGKGKVPGPEQFRELLDHAGRIAEINAQVNSQ